MFLFIGIQIKVHKTGSNKDFSPEEVPQGYLIRNSIQGHSHFSFKQNL